MVKISAAVLCLLGAVELADAQFSSSFSTSSLGSTLSSLGGRYTTSGTGTRYTSPSTTTGTRYTSPTTTSFSSLSSSTPSYTLSSSSTPSFTSSFSSATPSRTSYTTPSYSTSTLGSSSSWSSGASSTPSWSSGASSTPSYYGGMTEYVDPRVKTYPEVDSYLKKKDIFDQNKIRSYNLQISNSDFSTMKRDPTAEKWVPCTVTVDYGEITEQSFQGAGCRYKGSVGSLRMCLDPVTRREDGTCRKLSLKVDANKFNTESQKIGGLKKLNFHGMAVDHSLLAERSVYNMFQDIDVIGPRANNAKIYINGVYDGVYGNIEAIDDEFLKREFKNDFNKGEGALYKEAWIENRGIGYFKKKRENDKDEDAWMMEVVQAVESASLQDADYVLNKYFDTQSFVDVTAVNTLVGATDDWRIRHNFWWYVREDENGKKLVMIPWDYDRINDERADSRGPAPGRAWHDTIQAYDSKCTKRETSAAQKAQSEGHPRNTVAFWTEVNAQLPPNVDIPVQCDKITHLLSKALKDDVDRRVIELAGIISTKSVIDSKLNTWYQQLAPAVSQDRTGDPPTQWTFRNEVTQMKNWLNQRRDKATREAQGYGSFYNSPAASMFGGSQMSSMSSLSSFGTSSLGTFGASPFGTRTTFG